MSPDPIVKEVREQREEYAAQFDYDLRAIHEDLKAQEAAAGRKVVALPPRRRNNKRVLRRGEAAGGGTGETASS